jgi:hypothetical protein
MSKQSNSTLAEKRARLGEMVAWFESDEFVVELAPEKLKEAEALAADIERELREHKNTITVLKKRFDEAAD